MAEMTITQIEKAEFDLVDALAGLPAASNGTDGKRQKALEVLEKLRATKKALLARSPDVLRKSSKRAVAAPHWIGFPGVPTEVTAIVKAARDRQSEERRLAKRAGAERAHTDLGPALASIRSTLRAPLVGERNLIGFLNRYAAP